MPSDSASALLDMRRHIDLAFQFIAGLNYEAFQSDTRTVYAVTRCLEVISEASRRLPDEMKARHPSIAWKNMAGAGNSTGTTTRMSRQPWCGTPCNWLFHRCERWSRASLPRSDRPAES